jgi:hypothetical protein
MHPVCNLHSFVTRGFAPQAPQIRASGLG